MGKSGHSHPRRENSVGRREQRSGQCFYRVKNTKAHQETTRSEGRGMGQILPLRRSQLHGGWSWVTKSKGWLHSYSTLCPWAGGLQCRLSARAPSLQDLMHDDLRLKWYNNRNKVHNKWNALESSWKHPPPIPPSVEKLSSIKPVPDAKRVGRCWHGSSPLSISPSMKQGKNRALLIRLLWGIQWFHPCQSLRTGTLVPLHAYLVAVFSFFFF